MIARHALEREYPECLDPAEPLQSQLLNLIRAAAGRFQRLTADWIRVGWLEPGSGRAAGRFAQGNFNSDNCLVGGRTMDYGPFGFVEKYPQLLPTAIKPV